MKTGRMRRQSRKRKRGRVSRAIIQALSLPVSDPWHSRRSPLRLTCIASSSSETQDEPTEPAKSAKTAPSNARTGQKRKAASPSPSSSSSSSTSPLSSSSSSSFSSASSSSSSSSYSPPPPPVKVGTTTKKRKTGPTTSLSILPIPSPAVSAALTTKETASPAVAPLSGPSAREVKKLPSKRFERIKSDGVTFQHDGLKDNSYEGRVCLSLVPSSISLKWSSVVDAIRRECE